MVGDFSSAQTKARLLQKEPAYLANGLLMEAEIAMRQGNHAQALEKANQAFLHQSPTPSQRVFLAHLYDRMGKVSDARRVIDELSLENLDEEGMISLARYYAGQGNSDRVEEIYRRAIQRFPDHAEIRYAYGQYLCRQRRFQEAILHLEYAHRSLPVVDAITYQLGQAYLGARQDDALIPLIQGLFTRDANSVLAWRLKAEYNMARGHRREAIQDLEALVHLIPEAGALYAKLAELYYQEGDMSVAERKAQRAIELKEQTAIPYLVLGDIYMRQGRWQDARSSYEEVLRIQPAHLFALLRSGDCELNLKRFANAEALYRRALSLFPTSDVTYGRLARLQLAAGDRRGAWELARQRYGKNPNNPQAITEYANALVANNRISEARNILEKGIVALPKNGYLPLVAGDLAVLQGDLKEAVRYYGRAEVLAQDDPNQFINVASRYVAINMPKEAERVYLKACNRFPNDVRIMNETAWFFVDVMKEPQRAERVVSLLTKKSHGGA